MRDPKSNSRDQIYMRESIFTVVSELCPGHDVVSISTILYRYRITDFNKIELKCISTQLQLSKFTSIFNANIDDIASISSRKCTQLQLSIFNVDFDDIISICICTEINLFKFNVDFDDAVSKSIFRCLKLQLSIF